MRRKTDKKLISVTKLSIYLAFIACIIIGNLGILCYGVSVKSDLLNSFHTYKSSELLSISVNIFFALSSSFCIPINFYVGRNMFLVILSE